MYWMRRRITPLAVLLTAVLAVGCADRDDSYTAEDADAVHTTPATTEWPAELQARSEAFRESWNQDDPAVVAAFFTEDAVVTADTATFRGRDEIRDRWLEGVGSITAVQVHDETANASGSDWTSSGRYTMTIAMPDGPVQASGRYDNVWTRGADGQWYIRSMNVVEDEPPTGAQ
jgi:ketosteroid isomerase-like protein